MSSTGRRDGAGRLSGVLLSVLLLGGACAGPIAPMPDPGLVTSPPDEEAAASRGAAAAQIATRYLGVPYARGGAGPSGFDCSGLVMHVYARVGVTVPHNAAQQYRYGTPIPRSRLQPGDLVFFDRLQHNGIYLGDGRFIHATRPGGVKIAKLDGEWFRDRWVGARRF
jgi:cell wall-associated NlpC family hydrolase